MMVDFNGRRLELCTTDANTTQISVEVVRGRHWLAKPAVEVNAVASLIALFLLLTLQGIGTAIWKLKFGMTANYYSTLLSLADFTLALLW